MAQHWQNFFWKTGWMGFLIFIGMSFGSHHAAYAQIVPDTSLPTNSIVPPNCTVCAIDGGTLRGANLLHSFSQFSLPGANNVANFQIPNAIQNVLVRVTGVGEPFRSTINGTIRTNTAANLFLLNPNGITFGAKAQLAIGGSFVVTTANAIGLLNGDIFSDNPANPLPQKLLNVNPNALFFNQVNAQAIVNQSTVDLNIPNQLVKGLQAPQGKNLLMVGGNVRMEGGGLYAPEGRIELAGIREGVVSLDLADGNPKLTTVPLTRATVDLTNVASIDVRGKGDGSIFISAQDLNVTESSSILAGIANGSDPATRPAGNIDVRLTGTLRLTNGSVIDNSLQLGDATKGVAGAIGTAGNITVHADSVSLDGENRNFRASGLYSRIQEGTEGQSGQINLAVNSLLSVTNGAGITTSTRGRGNAGSVIINADTAIFDGQGRFNPNIDGGFRQSSAAFSAATEPAVGLGGSITLKVRSLQLLNGGALITSTLGEGKAGDVTVNANTIVIDGAGKDSRFAASGIYSDVASTGTGQGGIITVSADSQLLVKNGAGIIASTDGAGRGGDIIIPRVGTLIVKDGGQIAAKTSSSSPAGTLKIENADLIKVQGRSTDGATPSQLSFDTTNAGDAGILTINTQQLFVRGGAKVSARTSSTGDAGVLTVNATDSVTIAGAGSEIRFDTLGAGDARGIAITTKRLVVQDGGEATVKGTSTGSPGTLNITANSILISNGGRLTATTNATTGGNIVITLQPKSILQMSNGSKILSSALGPGNGGNISFSNPDIFVVSNGRDKNNDVLASAISGNGGLIIAPAKVRVLNFIESNRDTPLSDFTAGSVSGLPGSIIYEASSEQQPEETVPIDAVRTAILQGCRASRASAAQSKFIVTGRGGLPSSPDEALSGDAIQVGLVTRTGKDEGRSITEQERRVNSSPFVMRHSQSSDTRHPTPKPPIIEAQGWVKRHDGVVELVAYTPTTPQSITQPISSCPYP